MKKVQDDVIHFIPDVQTDQPCCGIETPSIPDGIYIERWLSRATCPACIKAAFSNHDIVSYVWGQMPAGEKQHRCGKAHCLVTFRIRGREWEFQTLCGLYDTPGNWEFSTLDWFLGVDGCKKCRSIYERLLRL